MNAAAMIAHHIATKGVTVCPPNVAVGGHSPGVCVAPVKAADGQEPPRDRFNAIDSAKRGRNAGRDASNAERARMSAQRRREIVKAYADDPRTETVYAIAARYNVTVVNAARMIREGGFKNVSTTRGAKCGQKIGGTWGSKGARMMAVYDALNAIAEKGEEMPSNPAMMGILGMGDSTICGHMTQLRKFGLIAVERRGIARIVTIVKTGIQTKRPASRVG